MKLHNFFILFLVCQLSSQTWQQTSITPNTSGQRYDDIFFIDENTGWAANGFFAAVYKTDDGGMTWTEQLSNTDLSGNYYFRNIEFLNENIGFLGTLNNSFFKTQDGGATWQEVTNISPNPNAICGLDAVNASTIYGCGAYFFPACVIKSSDGGDTWQYIDMSSYADGLVEILFVDEVVGYVAGRCSDGACVLKTIDGGISWQEVFNSGISGEYVWKLQFVDNSPNIIFGALQSVTNNPGKLIKSFNAGTSWQSLDAPETNVQAVGFINQNRGWMGGHTTGLYETNDGGMTWTDTGVGNNLNRIVILNEGLAYATGTSIYKFSEESLGLSEEVPTVDGLNLITLLENPVNQFLNISLEQNTGDNILLDIFDIKGKYVEPLNRIIGVPKTEISNYSYDVSHLSPGVYFLNLHNNLGQKSIRFIKK